MKTICAALLGLCLPLHLSAITPGPKLVIEQDRERILKAADAALELENISLTQHQSPLSEGRPNE
ncbi:MAG TPA: alginate lyase, partial [Prosthecobacter sp.]